MAEGFVLNISREMLQRLDAADAKIIKIGESAEKAMQKINEAFGKKLTGVEGFIKQLNDIQQELTKKKLQVNVDLALKNGALDSLKKQIEALGITIPVGVTATGTGGSNAVGSVPNLQSLLDSIVKITTNLDSMIKNFPFGKNVEAAAYTPNQIETLNKRARATLYRGELNALSELSNKEKERQRNLREQDKENQLRHKERLNQIKIEEEKNKLKVKAEIDELKRLAQAYKQMPTTINTKQVGNLIAQSKQSQSVNQRLIAIKNLKNAIKDLDTTDSRYQRTINHLNKEIRRQESELRKLGHQLDNINKRSRHLFDITGQLGRALSLMFSVSQITQYVSKMVNVRKEMELQQRSLQVLLQNKDKANELWNQTLDLAVKSPFRVKELVTYTKQLAAYRIESDKLFETNKMLADVSAGLGVDMQRLILAFGQVKSASFLRGCLGKGTPIRLYNEDIKEVQNIVVGDVIMGDDNTPRNVKEIIYGKEQMYIVKQGAFGDDYRVNENHILTLQDNITATIVDVYVKDYLKDKERYNGVKISEDGNIIYYPIELIKDNIDEYFGFVIDGNKRFLLGDGTITHNTELRQFTEAGIPMLEELAKYFGEIQGRAISVAEVFDMISKRMVTFADVEKVFQRMTGAGGVFFNMQEELSQTTAGMISNFHDSVDLMFNEMGKKNQGLINNFIKAARYLVDNWEAIGKTMKGALLTLLLYKAATIDINKNTDGIKRSWSNIKFLFSELKKNPLEFFQTFKGNIIITALTAIIALVGKAIAEHRKYKRAIEDVNKAHEKFRKSVSDVEVGFLEMFRNGNDNIDEYRDKLQELIGIAKQSYSIEIDFKVNELETIDEVSRKFDDLKEKILSFNQLSLEFSLDFVERDDRGWGLFQNYLGSDLKDLSASQKDMQNLASSIRGIMSGTIKDVSELDRLNEKAESLTFTIQELNRSGDTAGAKNVQVELDSITEQITTLENKLKGVDINIVKSLFPRGLDETEYEYIQRITNAISDLYEKASEKGIGTVLGLNKKSDIVNLVDFNISGRLRKYTTDLKEAEKELLKFYESSHSDVANLVNLSLRGQTLGFNPFDLIDAIKEQNQKSIDDLENIITRELTVRGVNPTEEVNKILQKIVEANNESEVREEIENLFDILNKQSLDEEVSKYVYNGLKSIATQKEFDEATLHKMLKDAENFYKNNQLVNDKGEVILETLDLDLIPKKEKATPLELKAWQKAYNEEVDEILNTLTSNEDKAIFLPLKIRTDLQGVATTKEKQRSVLNEAIDNLTKEIEQLKIANDYLKQQYDNNEISLEQYNDLYEKNIAQEENYVKHITHLRNLLGGDDDKSKGKDTATQRIKDQISLIRQLYEEYQKLSKEMGATTAKGNVLSRFADYAKELEFNIADIDFTNLQGIFDALQGLESSAKSAGADAMKALTKAMGETSVELELMFYIDERNKFENQIKDMFSDYEISLELDKLNIPKNLASQLFGVDTVDLDEIKTALQNKLNDLDSADILLTQQLQNKDIDENLKQSLLLQQIGNKQLREQTEANLRKISDMEQKELEERLKTYTKYLLNEQHERVKIRMETLRMLQEVEDTKEYTPAQRKTITDKIKEEERKKLAQQTWKDFEQSPMYMQMFDDVENMGKGALESLITQMGTLKDELQSMGLPASDLKEILGAINKAEEELERRNPFKNFAKNAEIAFNRSKELARLEKQRVSQSKKYDYAKDSYDNIQTSLVENEKILENLDKESLEYQVQKTLVDMILKSTNYWANEVDKAESNLSKTNNQINDINDSSNDFYDQLKNIGSITKSVVDGIFQITDAMSWLPEETQLTIDRLQSLSNNVFGIAGGIGSIMSGDIIGGITQIIGSLSGLIATFVEWSSGTKEATIQIERQGRILSNLQNKYDRLNEAINEAWDTRQIKEYNAELEKNLQQQIIAQKAIIAAQESIKGSDKYGSEQWLELQEAQDELQNLYDMQQELQDNIYEKITGGIIDNTLDAISSWVDAWYDAFKETGDGLKGLEDNFNEMLLNIVKRQAAMKVAGRFIDQWNSVLEQYVNDDDNLSLGEISSWANMIEQDLPALSSQLETFFKAFDGILGDTQGNLSGLQRGVTEIQESTAQELAVYLNSIRFIVSDSNAQLKLLVSAQTGATSRSENTMVEQLRVIAQQTTAINTLLNSLTAPHPTLSGRGLKVVI